MHVSVKSIKNSKSSTAGRQYIVAPKRLSHLKKIVSDDIRMLLHDLSTSRYQEDVRNACRGGIKVERKGQQQGAMETIKF